MLMDNVDSSDKKVIDAFTIQRCVSVFAVGLCSGFVAVRVSLGSHNKTGCLTTSQVLGCGHTGLPDAMWLFL